MSRTPRRLALAAGAALLLLTGCGDGAGARPGAAAVVGDEQISTDQLQGLVDRGLADPQAEQQLGADRAAFQRQALSRLINAEVLEQAAAENGVAVTDGEVADQRADFESQAGGAEALEQQAAQSGIAADDLDLFIRSIVLDQRLGDELTSGVGVDDAELQALYDQNIAQYDRVRSRHILVEDEATARRVAAEVTEDRSRFEALAAELSIDTSNKDRGGDLGLAGRGQFVPEFENAVFGAEPDSIVVVQTQFGWHVVEVLERQTTTLAEAEPELRRVALQEERQQRVSEVLRQTSEELGITVNPRFGQWDPETGSVVAEDSPNGVVSPGPGSGSGGDVQQEGEVQAPVEQPAG